MLDLLTPDLIVAHVGDVTPAALRDRGIRAVITDLDNTLVPWRSDEIAAGNPELAARAAR
jgi:predicted HAD superfamily phosphohydrolase YqeG